MIDDLLSFSRLSRQSLSRQLVEPAGIARLAFKELSSQVPDRKIDLNIQDLPACEADPSLLKQIFVNLLSNSLKFTGLREEARIEIGSLSDNGELIYYVKDNGVGFDMRFAHKLFGVFQRLHRLDEYEGTGVGLAIVQRIVHRHGGRIWTEAELDKGATFYFTLNSRAQ